MKISRSIIKKLIKESIDEMALSTHRELKKDIEDSNEMTEEISTFIQDSLSKNEKKLGNWFQTNRTFGDADVHVLPFSGRPETLVNALEKEGIEVGNNARNFSIDITADLLKSLNLAESEVKLNKNNVIMIPCVSATSERNPATIGEYYTPWRMLHSIFDCDIVDNELEDLQEDIPGAYTVSFDRFDFAYSFFEELPYEDILNCSNHGSFKIARVKENQRKLGKNPASAGTADFVDNPTEAFFELIVSAFIRKERGPNFIKTQNMNEEDYMKVYETIRDIADGARKELVNKCIIVNVTD